VRIKDRKYFVSDGNFKEIYFKGKLIGEDTSVKCMLKNVKVFVYGVQIVFTRDVSGPFVEETHPEAILNSQVCYIISADGYTLSVHTIDPNGKTKVLGNATTGVYGGEITTPIKSLKTSGCCMFNDKGAILGNDAISKTLVDGSVIAQLLPITTYTNLTQYSGDKWDVASVLEIYNPLKFGSQGLNTQLVNRYRVLLMGVSDTGILSAIGLRNSDLNIINIERFEVGCPFSDIKEIFSVAHIWSNKKNYFTMPVFRKSNDDLYFQAYIKNDINTTSGWLEMSDACTKVGNGRSLTGYCDGDEVRFYFSRDNKVYKTVMNLDTRSVTDEVFVCDGEYYKECSWCYWIRKDGVLSCVKK